MAMRWVNMGRKGKNPSRGEVRAMAHVGDVAAFILDRGGPMTAMKLQKLCYFSYGYHLAWEESRLFPERFQAWANGPVCRPLYDEHRGRLSLGPGDIPGNPAELNSGERESIELVLQGLGDLTAHQLSALTHAEGPWVSARERAGAGPLDRSSVELNDTEIFEYFDALASANADGSEKE